MNILCILASPFGEHSVSRIVAQEVLERLQKHYKDATISTRDLSEHAVPHWGAAEVAANRIPAAKRTEAEQKILTLSDKLCAELRNAEVLVIGSPMWNFSVPSTLKAWIDHIVREEMTFRYEKFGPVGLLTTIKKVYVIEATGGVYLEHPAQAMNHVGPYLTHLFQFLGAKDVVTITASGTAIQRDEALLRARSSLQALLM